MDIPASFQFGAALLLIVAGLVYVARKTRGLRSRHRRAEAPTFQELGPPRAIPCPDVVAVQPDLQVHLEREAESTRRRRFGRNRPGFHPERWALVRRLMSVLIVCLSGAAALLAISHVLPLSERVDRQLLQVFSWSPPHARVRANPALLLNTAPEGEDIALRARAAPDPAAAPAEPDPAARLFSRDLAPRWVRPVAWLVALAPLGLVLLGWWLPQRRLWSALTVQSLLALLAVGGMLATAAAAAELSGARAISEEVIALRAMPRQPPEHVATRTGPAKVRGRPRLPGEQVEGEIIYEARAVDGADAAAVESTRRAFRLGPVDLPDSATPAIEAYPGAPRPVIGADTTVLVAGLLRKGRFDPQYPIVLAPLRHVELYVEMAETMRGRREQHTVLALVLQVGWMLVAIVSFSGLTALMIEAWLGWRPREEPAPQVVE